MNVSTTLPLNENPYGLNAIWQQGDNVILFVALLLFIMSLGSWTIIVIRTWHLLTLRKQVEAAKSFWHTQNFQHAKVLLGSNTPAHPFRYLSEQGHSALIHHQTHQQDLHGKLPLTDWVTDSLSSAIDESAERLQRGLTLLASVGSTAPFIGLFGTVWGIYHALVNIGASGQASIDQIAGPVGEALVMTAFGLAVAIPAVLGYNALVRANKSILSKLKRFAHQLHAYLLTGVHFSNSQTEFIPAKVSQLKEAK
jgi:biopolymer transport protein ExbB